MVKALFIYAGISRKELEKEVEAGESPDTSFFGFNHVKNDSRIEADYLQITKDTYKLAGSLVRRFTFLNAAYLLLALGKLMRSYEVIFITSSAYLDILFLKRLGFFHRQRFLLLNIDLTIKTKKSAGIGKLFLLSKIKAADKILCLSEPQRKYLIDAGIEPRKLVFMRLGVDKNFYQPLEGEGEIFLTVGRDADRDYETFMEAMKGMDEEAVIICSPKNIRSSADKIPPNVTVLHDKPYSELRSYYQKAKFSVVPSKPEGGAAGSDCSGQTVILDSLAYGRPVIASYRSWFKDYFEEGKHLIWVPPKDPSALREAIRKLSAEESLRQRLKEEGRKLIDESCNSEAMGKKIAELILG